MTAKKPKKAKPGDLPGLHALSPVREHAATIDLIEFDTESMVEYLDTNMEKCAEHANNSKTTWIHVRGQPGNDIVLQLGDIYSLHTLALEDVANTGQRPKVDVYDDEAFIVLNLPVEEDDSILLKQVSLFIGEGYLVSFYEGDDDVFEPIKERLRGPKAGRMRRFGCGHLCYAMIDLVVDSAFPILDKISDNLDQVSDDALADPTPKVLEQIHTMRRTLITLRRGLTAQRDVINILIRDDHTFIEERTVVYLRDCYDHAIRINEAIENYRDLTSSTQDLYMSSVSNRMNDVMKVLTIISTLFIPLSFFTGLYGMNFNTEASRWNMPELSLPYAYPVLIGVLLSISFGMLAFFKHKDWW